MNTLSLKITNLATLNNVTETELAKHIKMSLGDLHHFLLSKHPDKKILKKIAQFFEIPVDELIQDNRIESIYIAENERYHDTPSSVLRYLMPDSDITQFLLILKLEFFKIK